MQPQISAHKLRKRLAAHYLFSSAHLRSFILRPTTTPTTMKLSIAITTTLAVTANLVGAADTGLRQRKLQFSPTTGAISCINLEDKGDKCSSENPVADVDEFCAMYVELPGKKPKKRGGCTIRCRREDEVSVNEDGTPKKNAAKFMLATFIDDDNNDCELLCGCANVDNEEEEYLTDLTTAGCDCDMY